MPEVQAMTEVTSGAPFRLTELSKKIIDKYLTPEQQQLKLKKEQSEKVDAVHSIIKFVVQLLVKNQHLFQRLGDGVYKANLEEEFTQEELDEVALDEGDEEVSEYEGWIYAFSFPALVSDTQPFPIKVGKTLVNVEERVTQQCKGSATFDNPVILGRWQVNRVGPTELAIHNVLKARGKWRESVPGASHICHLHEISYSLRFAHLGLFHVDCFFHIFRLFHLSLEREFLRVLKAAYSLGFRGVCDVKT